MRSVVGYKWFRVPFSGLGAAFQGGPNQSCAADVRAFLQRATRYTPFATRALVGHLASS
jgi:hypothetical protein